MGTPEQLATIRSNNQRSKSTVDGRRFSYDDDDFDGDDGDGVCAVASVGGGLGDGSGRAGGRRADVHSTADYWSPASNTSQDEVGCTDVIYDLR